MSMLKETPAHKYCLRIFTLLIPCNGIQVCLRSSHSKNPTTGLVIYFETEPELLGFVVQN